MTVNGPADPDKLGITLTHEHILVDFIGADSTGYFRWNRDSVIARAMPSLLKAKDAGVKTFIECTPEYLGRDPVLLRELSQKTGLTFITNTGYYGFNNKYLPESFYTSDAAALAAKWTGEFLNGIEGTGIKPGFIKISVNPADSLSPADEKIITAAAITHLNTGLTIASHTGPDKPAFAQIKILKEMGVDPSAFVWVHAERGTDERIYEAATSGVWISFDNIRNRPNLKPGDQFSIDWYASRIAELKKRLLLHKLLLSHDSGWYDPAKPGGGTFIGYTDIFEFLLPVLKEKGLTDADIDQILVKNPAEAFKINIRRTP
jgi:phosphotriesterase-related protein